MEVSSAPATMPAPNPAHSVNEDATIKGIDSMAALGTASSKLGSPEKKKDFSRPVSISSGNSMTSAVETQESPGRLADSHDSLSTMPTPRNTFLYPPTGINLADRGSAQASATQPAALPMPNWDSDQHQKQLQLLLEQRGLPSEASCADIDSDVGECPAAQQPHPSAQLSYDDSYFLLNQPAPLASGPESRNAAVAQLRQLAGTLGCAAGGSRGPHPYLGHIPLSLAPPVEALGQLEEALSGIMTRRQVPNRTHVYHSQRGGAGSIVAHGAASAAASAIAAGKAARRRQRMSLMSAGQDSSGGGCDDRHSMRSRASVASGDIASSLTACAGPYSDFNSHMERLTACISKLQPASLDASGNGKPTGAALTPSIAGVLPPPVPSLSALTHNRQGSVVSLGAKSFASTQSLVVSPLAVDGMGLLLESHQARQNSQPRLSPVTEHAPVEESADASDPIRPRSSSHASVVSGKSTESRRRIVVTEVPTSAQYPNLFGSSIADGPLPDRAQPPKSPSVTAPSFHSGRSESAYSHTGSDHRPQQQSPPPMPQYSSHRRDPSFSYEFGKASSIAPKSIIRGGGIVAVSAPAVSVREITPASRLALWLTMHSTVEATKSTLWRRKQWQRRFGIFAGNVLYLFKSSAPAATALTVIRLSPSTIVCVNDSFQGRSWVIEITQTQPADGQAATPLPGSAPAPQSWYLQTEMRNEMVALLKQLKAAVNELQVQPDVERREEERLRNRRKKQRKEAKKKTDVCPWEVDEFSDRGSDPMASDFSDGSEDGESLGQDGHGVFRIPDDELFPSEDDDNDVADDDLASTAGDTKNAAHLDAYSMGGGAKGARPATLKLHNYTGTGGIAEWGAHRLQMPYMLPSPSADAGGIGGGGGGNARPATKLRSFSADPPSIIGRRPSLADALAPPISAMQELTPVPAHSPTASPRGPPQAMRSRSAIASIFNPAVRNSMMLRSDASALIDQMFASASRELSTTAVDATASSESSGRGSAAVGGGNLFVVHEEE
ncbi:hypothetical protein GGI02_004058 [Coemansia sp. RSA 2322]|nr:hypothetical protein GGI02_004058 [Coemansia sp. RSA 2322]